IELRQKITRARVLFGRWLVEWSALFFLLLAISRFLWRGQRPGRVLAPSMEARFAAPVYLLLILGALRRDPAVLHALLLPAGGSRPLLWPGGWRKPPARRAILFDTAVLVACHLALFVAVLIEADLVDPLGVT